MEEIYKINNNGIITLNGIVIPMIEGTVLHNNYVQYLRNGGVVEQTDETTIADIELLKLESQNILNLNQSVDVGITTTFKTIDGLNVVVKNGLVVSIE